MPVTGILAVIWTHGCHGCPASVINESDPQPPCEEMQYDRTIGMPRGRLLPLAFGMYTRRAGLARQGWQVDNWSTNFPRAAGVLTTSLSTPGVYLPAFT
jgi:hypothetical protein